MADPDQIAQQINDEASAKAASVVDAAAAKIDEAQRTAEHIALAAVQSKHQEQLDTIRKEHETWRVSETEQRRSLEARVMEQGSLLGKMSSILEQLVQAPKETTVAVVKEAEKAEPLVNPESKEATKVKKEAPARVRRFL